MAALASLFLLSAPLYAQDDNSKSSSKEEGNRNVMLNASSANGPREIQIGLPSADVNVLENGLPVTYATNPHSVNSVWRGDASLSHNGLLKISETAITTGNIGYAVNSFTQLGQEGFHTNINYKMSHFGQQEFSVNLNGGIGKGWYYSANMYQDFDPGTFKIKSAQYQDRTQIYKFALTKRYNGNRGELTAMWHYANSHPAYTYATQSAPFIYSGEGGVKEYGKFKLGTTSYLPVNSDMVYVDMKDGQMKTTSLYDYIENRSNNFSLMNTYNWDNGLQLKPPLCASTKRTAPSFIRPRCRCSMWPATASTPTNTVMPWAWSRTTPASMCRPVCRASTAAASTSCSSPMSSLRSSIPLPSASASTSGTTISTIPPTRRCTTRVCPTTAAMPSASTTATCARPTSTISTRTPRSSTAAMRTSSPSTSLTTGISSRN